MVLVLDGRGRDLKREMVVFDFSRMLDVKLSGMSGMNSV